MMLIVNPIGGLEAWGSNTFLQLHDKIANTMNQSDCWICSRLPQNAGHGHPILATVFPNLSGIARAFDNISLNEYTGETRESQMADRFKPTLERD